MRESDHVSCNATGRIEESRLAKALNEPPLVLLRAVGAPLLAIIVGAPNTLFANAGALHLFGGDLSHIARRVKTFEDETARRFLDKLLLLPLDASPQLEQFDFFFGPSTQNITFACQRLSSSEEATSSILIAALTPLNRMDHANKTNDKALISTNAQMIYAQNNASDELFIIAPAVQPHPSLSQTAALIDENSVRQRGDLQDFDLQDFDLQDLLTDGRKNEKRTAQDKRFTDKRFTDKRFTWRADKGLCFTQLSSQLGEALGLENAEFLGANLLDLAQNAAFDPSQRLASLLQARATWSQAHVFWPMKSGAPRPITLGATPIFDAQTQFMGYRGFGLIAPESDLDIAAANFRSDLVFADPHAATDGMAIANQTPEKSASVADATIEKGVENSSQTEAPSPSPVLDNFAEENTEAASDASKDIAGVIASKPVKSTSPGVLRLRDFYLDATFASDASDYSGTELLGSDIKKSDEAENNPIASSIALTPKNEENDFGNSKKIVLANEQQASFSLREPDPARSSFQEAAQEEKTPESLTAYGKALEQPFERTQSADQSKRMDDAGFIQAPLHVNPQVSAQEAFHTGETLFLTEADAPEAAPIAAYVDVTPLNEISEFTHGLMTMTQRDHLASVALNEAVPELTTYEAMPNVPPLHADDAGFIHAPMPNEAGFVAFDPSNRTPSIAEAPSQSEAPLHVNQQISGAEEPHTREEPVLNEAPRAPTIEAMAIAAYADVTPLSDVSEFTHGVMGIVRREYLTSFAVSEGIPELTAHEAMPDASPSRMDKADFIHAPMPDEAGLMTFDVSSRTPSIATAPPSQPEAPLHVSPQVSEHPQVSEQEPHTQEPPSLTDAHKIPAPNSAAIAAYADLTLLSESNEFTDAVKTISQGERQASLDEKTLDLAPQEAIAEALQMLVDDDEFIRTPNLNTPNLHGPSYAHERHALADEAVSETHSLDHSNDLETEAAPVACIASHTDATPPQEETLWQDAFISAAPTGGAKDASIADIVEAVRSVLSEKNTAENYHNQQNEPHVAAPVELLRAPEFIAAVDPSTPLMEAGTPASIASDENMGAFQTLDSSEQKQLNYSFSINYALEALPSTQAQPDTYQNEEKLHSENLAPLLPVYSEMFPGDHNLNAFLSPSQTRTSEDHTSQGEILRETEAASSHQIMSDAIAEQPVAAIQSSEAGLENAELSPDQSDTSAANRADISNIVYHPFEKQVSAGAPTPIKNETDKEKWGEALQEPERNAACAQHEETSDLAQGEPSKIISLHPVAPDPDAKASSEYQTDTQNGYLNSIEQKAFQEIARVLSSDPHSDSHQPASHKSSISGRRARDLIDLVKTLVRPLEMSAPFEESAFHKPALSSPPQSPLEMALMKYAPIMLERIPIGLAVTRGGETLYANRTLLDLLDYESLAAFQESGGVEMMLQGQTYATSGSVQIKARDAEMFLVNMRLQTMEWEEETATVLSLRRARDNVSQVRTSPEEKDVAPATETDNPAQENKELRALVNASQDGVALLDSESRILWLNNAFERLLGLTSHARIGEYASQLVAKDSLQTLADYFYEAKSFTAVAYEDEGHEISLRAADGALIPVRASLKQINDKQPAHFAFIIRDLRKLKDMQRSLSEAQEQAEKASALKSEFLARVSHEIRTPLNAILGFADVIMHERFGPVGNQRYRDYMRDIHKSGEHVMSLVNDLLDLSKIEAGKMELEFTETDVNAIVSECVSIMQPQASRARIVMRLSLAPHLLHVASDQRALRQIILNLLSNAIKYNEAGGQVIVSTALTDDGHIAARIKDTGLGMTAEEMQTALEPFRQVANARRTEGTGLGLPLTKALVEANQALFSIKSQKGQGTLVEVIFPSVRVVSNNAS